MKNLQSSKTLYHMNKHSEILQYVSTLFLTRFHIYQQTKRDNGYKNLLLSPKNALFLSIFFSKFQIYFDLLFPRSCF